MIFCNIIVSPCIVRTVAFLVAFSLSEAEKVPLHGRVGGAAVGLLFCAAFVAASNPALVGTPAPFTVRKARVYVKVLAPVAGTARLHDVTVDLYLALVQTPPLRHTLEVVMQGAVEILTIRVLGLATFWLAT